MKNLNHGENMFSK